MVTAQALLVFVPVVLALVAAVAIRRPRRRTRRLKVREGYPPYPSPTVTG
ncbi:MULTISPECIES: hypothetical protein [Myxococcus]|nr:MULTISPECIES: hypothetical protein [Myxococcus]NTX14335.1 hypothetical protein [Myxococcus sp. CA056]NTX36995.1 hypothetical protein [Myxococcus sp. CA033]NTX51402.1 hypothetical protein [Myxococcus sp. CA039A]